MLQHLFLYVPLLLPGKCRTALIKYLGVDSIMKNVNKMSSQAFIQKKKSFISVVTATIILNNWMFLTFLFFVQ